MTGPVTSGPVTTGPGDQNATECGLEEGCITCGDVAVPLTVVSVTGADASCRDDRGRQELVATELVGAVEPGDRLLVHAGVAIERLADAAAPERKGQADALRR